VVIIREGDMALWEDEAGKYGGQESRILEQNVVAIRWNDLGDLSNKDGSNGRANKGKAV
jgi:hypothetical protein